MKMLFIFLTLLLPLGASSNVEVQNNNLDPVTVSAAHQITKANPGSIYWDDTPDVLFGIPIFKVIVGPSGYIQEIITLRKPQNPEASETVQLAISAIKKAEPFKYLVVNDEPVEFVQTFLFREDLKFKLRVLD